MKCNHNFFETADHDDRVVPAHSFKFIAELQYKLGKQLPNTPLLIRIDADSGHGSGKPVTKWIEEYTDIGKPDITQFLAQLGHKQNNSIF